MAEDNKTIVSRIQHRRGLKQDLPQPLRPGEIGLATDSRQLYIGGDPNNPTAADYHSISYYENTLSAKEHVRSIANNNIVAFSVPTFKVVQGQFDGISNQQTLHPTDARSIISAGISQSKPISSAYPVFSPVVTDTVSSTLAATKSAGALTMVISQVSGQDNLGNIRVTDEVAIDGFDVRPRVTNVVKNANGADYDVTIDRTLTDIPSGTSISFTPNKIFNNFTGQPFRSTDITVYKTGVQINPETDITRIAPSSSTDYAIDASNLNAQGSHVLNFRSAPTVRDEVTATYYSNANIIAAINGVQSGTMKGNISAQVEYPSFYQNKELWPATNGVLPEYKRFKTENIRISRGTGFGFVGMDLIHIAATADGANVATTTIDSVNDPLGNLFVARDDERYAVSNISTISNGESYTVEMTGDPERFVTALTAGDYNYSHVLLVGSSQYEDEYFHRSLFPVGGVSGSTLTLSMPMLPFVLGRGANAALRPSIQGNKFQNDPSGTVTELRITTPSITSAQIKEGDWVRLGDTTNGADTSAAALDGKVLKVLESGDGYFDVRISDTGSDYLLPGNTAISGVVAAITNSGIKFVNHGNDANTVDTTLQVFSEDHGIKPGGTTNVQISTGAVFPTNDYDINTGTNYITDNTFFVINRPGSMSSTASLMAEQGLGGLVASGDTGVAPNALTQYPAGSFEIVPVLKIDLSSANHFNEVLATVNRNLVEINGTTVQEQIFPKLEWIPQADGNKNAVYLSQRPAYSSVGVGGLEFTLFEDKIVPTLSRLGLSPGFYDRPNNTVKAKFEQWLNGLVNSRDVNLISNAFLMGPLYADLAVQSNQFSDQYSLTIDNTFDEIAFASREEAGIFNSIVNNVYGNSLYDKLLDSERGSRGLVNLKNNIELSTRELASFGNKITTYVTMDEFVIAQSDNSSRVLAEFDPTGQYNVFKVTYSMQHTVGTGSKYLRTGTWMISASSDFTDATNGVLFSDNFTSIHEVSHGDPVVEPKFDAVVSPNGMIEIRLVDDQLVQNLSGTNTYTTHNLNVNLRVKYVTERWSAE